MPLAEDLSKTIEWDSWKNPSKVDVAPVPEIDSRAPSCEELDLPAGNGKPTIITFLRHCGCPFAEKSFLSLRDLACKTSSVNFIAVSHSSEEATEKWLYSVGGVGAPPNDDVQVIVDPERKIYAAWGLGTSSAWHVLSPTSMYGVYSLGKKFGIWNRPTESGTRWQTAGSFAVDAEGKVKWVKVATQASDMPNFEDALLAIDGSSGKSSKL